MTENRNGFVVEAELRQVSGTVERETAKDMIVRYSPGAKRITVGADRELQSDSSGGTTRVGTGNDLGSPDPSWHVIKAAADFDGNTVADVLLQNDNGLLAIWELQNTATTGLQFLPNGQFNIGQNPGPTWHAVAAGDFNGDGRAGILFFNDNHISAAIWEMRPGGPAIGQTEYLPNKSISPPRDQRRGHR